LVPSHTVSHSPAETFELGKRFAATLKAGDVAALFGPLGGGKTTFVKGVVSGLESKEVVTSPTFVLLNVYSGKIPVYHFDFYRLDNPSQLEALNLGDYFYGNGVCLIEWPEMVLPLLSLPFYEVRFELVGETERKIEIKRAG